ncbi:hypothetical protein GCK72_020390 [Caenorhabditis remanei]|uniref:F-box domain-containing protein n=1 Tax=Caenorhabditis remanei TaxID=31234 RepID=A0A6A5GGM9_CAERE|nr:hypothetical protein GCK72_020390 [Caenorhabditis remanei]KAF1753833.1 hypothetical protein GCK72_020390 [Caenorhabditis remanei]
MLDSPHLSAKDLGPLIINNISQWKTPEKSYENYEKLCDAIGNKKISFEDFESLFNQYSRKFHLKLEIEEQKDKIYWCVLSDIIHQRPIDNSYSDILEAFGSDVINKKDFEKWLDWSNLRIASKNLTFTDLPLDIIRRIIRMADTETQAQLRKLCYFLNIEIGQLDPKCKNVSVEFGPDFIDFNGKISKYTKHGDGKTDYSKYIMEDLAFVLKNQKLHLDSLSTSYNPELDHNKSRDRFETLLKSLKRKIPVKNCSILIKNQTDAVAVLPYLKPGELKSLKFMRDADDGWILFIDRIAALPQWKRAKHVYFDGRIVSCLTEFYHFATFEVHLLLIHPEVLARLTRFQMNVSFANDPIALRRLIAYEALGRVPVFQAYKNMCKRIGDNVMTYPEYEFWYWRFIQGEMNLNHERRDTSKKLLELPLEILLSIFEKFTPMERLIMRKVSRVVRTCIDSIDPKISRIDFESKRDRGETMIDYKTFDVRYQGTTDCLVTSVWMQPSKSILIRNTNHSELALNDLSIVLSNPKLNLKSLEITSDAEKLKGLQPYLQSLSHKIRVEKVKIRTEDSIEETMILPFLEPGNLEEITICFKDYCKRTRHFYTELIPAMILPFLAFLLIREIGKGRLARRQLMRSQATKAKPDYTTIVISTMTVVSMISEMPYGIHNMVFLYYTDYSRDEDMINFLIRLRDLLDFLVTLNTMSHCLISLTVSSQYQNTVVSLLPIVRKLKKPRNIIKVTPSGTSEGNMMTRLPTTKDI